MFAVWLLLFLGSLIVYAATASRGTQWQDGGYFILSIVKGELRSPLGLALTHPLHHGLGRFAVWSGLAEPSYAVTLVSSWAAALAVANLYGVVRCLTGRACAALFAALSLAVAHTFWHLATVAEVYTLSAAILAAECWCLVAFLRDYRRACLWGMLLFNGLGIANHLQGALTTPVLLVVILVAMRRRQVDLRDAAIGVVLWMAGTLPYTSLVAASLASNGWSATIRSVLFGTQYAGAVLNTSLSLRIVLVSVGFTVLSFPNLLVPAAVRGLFRYRRIGVLPRAARALLAGLAIHALFACRYNVVDQYTFFLSTYVFLAIFAGVGAVSSAPHGRLTGRWGIVPAAWLLVAATPGLYGLAPPLARHFRLLDGVIHHKPYRDDYVYLLAPWSCMDDSADRMAREAVALARPPGVILVEDLMAVAAVDYHVLLAERSGHVPPVVKVIRPADRAAVLRESARPGWRVVLVPLDVRRIPEPGLELQRRGDLYVSGEPSSRPSTGPE